MAILSTGPIENRPVGGVRPTQQVTVKLVNNDSANSSTVLIRGFHLNGTRTLYVLETVTLTPNEVATRNYFANFDAFQFVFTTSGPAEQSTEISIWGKSGSGQLIAAHRLVSDELLGSEVAGPGVQTVTSGPIFRNANTSFIQVSVQNVTDSPQTVTVSIQNLQNTCEPEEFPKFGFLCGDIQNEPDGSNPITVQNGVIFFPPEGFFPVLTPFTFIIPARQLFSIQAYPSDPILPPNPCYEVQVTYPSDPVIPSDPVFPPDPVRVNSWGIDGFGMIQTGNTVLHHQFTRFLPTGPI